MKKTVLLVEDDAVLRAIVTETLQREYRVLEASDCSEAKGWVKEPFHLALIDYSLPDGNGLDVLKALRQERIGLPAILMTVYSTKDLAIKSLRAGVTDYLEKPITLKFLVRRISEILNGVEGGGVVFPERAESREEVVMDGIASFIEENCTEELTRDYLADKTCMNRYKFSKMFNRRFGKSVRSFVNEARMRKAIELLSNHALNITDVAHTLGYRNIVHFERVFKAEYRISPVHYRRNAAKPSHVS